MYDVPVLNQTLYCQVKWLKLTVEPTHSSGKNYPTCQTWIYENRQKSGKKSMKAILGYAFNLMNFFYTILIFF